MIDTLRYTSRLEGAGFNKKQAEESVKILVEVMETNLATKIDIIKLENEMNNRFLKVENEIKSTKESLQNEIKNSAIHLESKIEKVKDNMTIKLGSMLIIAVIVLAAIIKL